MTNLQPHTVCVWCRTTSTLSGGHYTSYCKPSHGNVWYSCNDRSVSRLRTPVKTSTAYLFYNSLQNVRVLLVVPMVLLLWCEAWGGWGTAWYLWVGDAGWEGMGGLMPGLWWGWWMAVLRQTNVGCRVLWSFPYTFCTPSVPVFPILIGPIVSLPYFPYPFMPLISHNNDTCTHGLMLRAAVLCRTQWLVVDLSPKVFLTCLLGCLRAGKWVG